MSTKLEKIGMQAKEAAKHLLKLNSSKKKEILLAMAEALLAEEESILTANKLDIDKALLENHPASTIDRLTLTLDRIQAMAHSFISVSEFSDPIGSVITNYKHPKGFLIEQVRVPLGVIALIYEARPNVTAEATALCLQSSNALILRGSAQALNSNQAIVKCLQKAGDLTGLPKNSLQLIEDENRDSLKELVKLNNYIDVLIPRGGSSLKEFINKEASIPIIETGAGVCHAYVAKDAEYQMAYKIIHNGKTQRPGVCNALETILIDKNWPLDLTKKLVEELIKAKVEIRAESTLYNLLTKQDFLLEAKAEDFGFEFLSNCLSIRIVDGIEEAISWINKYGSHHSEVIITNCLDLSERFTQGVDSAVVYVNVSTRFSDGGEFGFGGEIGISTQKMHARGPFSFKELTTTKYIVHGDGQIR